MNNTQQQRYSAIKSGALDTELSVTMELREAERIERFYFEAEPTKANMAAHEKALEKLYEVRERLDRITGN